MKRLTWLFAACLAAAAPLAAADGVKIGNTIPYDPAAPVRDAIKAECGLDSLLSQALVEFGKGNIQTTSEDLQKAKGKVFVAKIAGVWATGGPWGGASIRVEGELRDNGKVIGTVASRRNTTRGGYGACGKIHVSARKVAEDIAGWMNSPTMDARLGDAK
jgi:hypothetical protein